MRYVCRFFRICVWALLVMLLVDWFLHSQHLDAVPESARGRGSRPKVLAPRQEPEPSDAEWQSVTGQRKQLLTGVCANSSLHSSTHVSISRFVLDRIFFSDKHKILFCQTPKVGNTQWKKVLMVLNGGFSSVEEIPEDLVHNHHMNGLPRLSSLPPRGIVYRLNHYFKFFMVRDPFERLISAFKDKFIVNSRSEDRYRDDIAPAIRRRYHRVWGSSPIVGSGLHFDDFVRYLGDEEGRRDLDQQIGSPVIHWTTYAELCAPCEISYDVIGHHETLERDAPYILRAAGVEQLVAYPHIPPGITLYNQTEVERYFSGISTADIRRLYARFQGDFHLFGYPTPDFLLQSNHQQGRERGTERKHP